MDWMGTLMAGLVGAKIAVAIIPLLVLAATTWMTWRIVEKAGFPGYVGLLTLTILIPGIGWLIWIVLHWVLAFMAWPRDGVPAAATGYLPAGSRGPAQPLPSGGFGMPAPSGPALTGPAPSAPALAPPQPAPQAQIGGHGPTTAPAALTYAPAVHSPGWALGLDGQPAPVLTFGETIPTLTVTGSNGTGDLVVIDPSVASPHARFHVLPGRLGLEDSGSPGGTFIDGAQLLPIHGVREITASRRLRFGTVELTLNRT